MEFAAGIVMGVGAANTRQDHPDGKDQVGGAKEGDRAFKLVEGGMVRSAVLSPDGATLVASTVVFPKDGAGKPSSPLTTRLQVVDAVTGKKLRTIDLDGDEAFWLAFTPDGKGVIGATSHYTPRGAGDKNTARLWDITTGKEVRRFTGHPVYVYGIALSRDGKVLASCGGGSYDAHGKELPGDVRLWDVASGKELAQLEGHTMSVSRVAFSPDGVTLASGGHDRTVRLWDTKARKETLKLDHGGSALDPLGAVDGLAFSPDGKHLASIGQGRLVVWDVATGEEVRELKGGRHVAFSPDGALIASGREDKVVYLWETATGKEVATFTGYTSTGGSVSFSTDGKTLITAGADDTVRLWAIPRVKRGSTPQ